MSAIDRLLCQISLDITYVTTVAGRESLQSKDDDTGDLRDSKEAEDLQGFAKIAMPHYYQTN